MERFVSHLKYKYAKTPQYFVKVISYGWFNERRVEGYGTFPLPQKPGKYNIEVLTWRPKTSLYNRSGFIHLIFAKKMSRKNLFEIRQGLLDVLFSLRAFFLGGVDELVSIKTAGYSDGLKKISRIGMQGVNGGTISIKLNVILHHSHPVIKDKVKIGEARNVLLFLVFD